MPFDPDQLIESWKVLRLCHRSGKFTWINRIDYTEAVQGLVFAPGGAHCGRTVLAPEFVCKMKPNELVVFLRNMTWRDLTVKIDLSAHDNSGPLHFTYKGYASASIQDRLESGFSDFGRDACDDIRAYKCFPFLFATPLTTGFTASVIVSVTHWDVPEDPEAFWERSRIREVKI